MLQVCNLFGYNPTATRLFGEYILDIPKASINDVSVVAEYVGSGIVYKHFRINKKSTILDVKKELNDYILLLNNDQKDEMILGDLEKDEITFVIRIKNEEDYYLDELKTKPILTLEMMNNSAKKGYLNCLKYLHENGCYWSYVTCYRAAWNGNLDCLKYLHDNRCSWDEDTCNCAAWNGNLDCLKYAHENGCSWNEDTCNCAARKGNLDCLKYAHENGCQYDKQECINKAKKNDHEEIIDYLESI